MNLNDVSSHQKSWSNNQNPIQEADSYHLLFAKIQLKSIGAICLVFESQDPGSAPLISSHLLLAYLTISSNLISLFVLFSLHPLYASSGHTQYDFSISPSNLLSFSFWDYSKLLWEDFSNLKYIIFIANNFFFHGNSYAFYWYSSLLFLNFELVWDL